MASTQIARPQTSVKIISTSGGKFVPPSTFYQPPKPDITGVTPNSSWWTAGQPILPLAPDDTSPRGFQFLSEQNKIFTPRANEFLTFEDLRRLASYPLAAIMINLYANAIAARQFRIRLRQIPGMNNKQREQAEKTDKIIPIITNFLMNPNPDSTWREFVYQWMSEVQVTDAPALFVRRNLKGDVGELRLIDGTMIARYIDDNGWTPTSESPAYAQLWWGTPAWDLTRDQLIYRPKSPRVYKIYGNSPTERVARLLELGYARLELKLQWAENGTIPDGLMVVPPDAPAELVERQQAWMNAVMTGNMQRRVQLRLIQGFAKDGKDQILFPKEKMLMDPYDEMEIRELAVAYDVPKQRFMEQMNRASAETAQESAEEEGYGPGFQYVSDTMNLFVQSPLYLNQPNYEFTYADQRESDILKQAEADDIYIKNGSKSWNEVRDNLGLDARQNPMDDVPLAFGQPVYNAYDSAAQAAALKAPPKPAGELGEGDEEQPTGTATILPPARSRKSRVTGLAIELKKVYSELSPKEIEELNKDWIAGMLRSGHQNNQFDKVHPGATINPNHFSLQGETARDKMAARIEKQLESVRKAVVAKVKAKKVRKADEDDINKILNDNSFWESLWIDLPADIAVNLEDAIKAGMTQGMLQLDVNISSSKVINELNSIAQAAAKSRAAEMVGMAWDADGNLVANPKAQYVISDTTRNELRKLVTEAFGENTPMSELISDIQDAGTFSVVRAQMIARTEVNRAQAMGTYSTWEKTGVVKTVRWQHSNLDNVCDQCVANADAGEIAFGKAFPSGDKYPPVHPNCRCVVVAAKTGK